MDGDEPPFVVDLRHPSDFDNDPRTVPGAFHFTVEEIEAAPRADPARPRRGALLHLTQRGVERPGGAPAHQARDRAGPAAARRLRRLARSRLSAERARASRARSGGRLSSPTPPFAAADARNPSRRGAGPRALSRDGPPPRSEARIRSHAAREWARSYSSRWTPQSASKTANTRRLLLRGSSGVKKSPERYRSICRVCPTSSLAVPEPYAHLAGVGGSSLVEILGLVAPRVAVEASNEEHRLELRQRDLDTLGIRLAQGGEAQAGLLGIKVGVSLQDPPVGIPDDHTPGAPADPEPPARRGRPALVSPRETVDTVTPCGHASFTVSGNPRRPSQNPRVQPDPAPPRKGAPGRRTVLSS